MTFRLATAVLLTAGVVLGSGCQSEQPPPPTPTLPSPPPPPPTTTPDPPETNDLIPGFTGLYFTPGQPLVLAEGSSVFVDVNWVGGGDVWREPTRYQVVSGAPPTELSVTPSTVEIGPGTGNADAVLLTAVADDQPGEVPETYTIHLRAGEQAVTGWAWDFSRTQMQVTIVEAESPPLRDEPFSSACDPMSLRAVTDGETRDVGSWMRAVHGDDLRHYVSGDILLRATHPGSALTLLAPYRRPFAHREEAGGSPLYRPYPFGFLIDLDLRETGSGFEQAMSLAWFDDLHLRLETPGCAPQEAICENGACRVR
ncbi:MAG: hypothetical protein OYL41_00470 [Acidobacteriota bacterium]|nr:hypothetical protein [Acidobacteriota bacterium]